MYRTSLIALALLVAGTAQAVNLKNEDSSSYDIKVQSSSSTTSTSINGGTTQNDRCSGDCTIVVEGVGSQSASGDQTVVIKGGKLSVK